MNVKQDANLTAIETLKQNLATRDYAQLIDFISGFIFPFIFLMFNIIYWATYFNMVGNFLEVKIIILLLIYFFVRMLLVEIKLNRILFKRPSSR
jgi:hypothetical protein